MQFVDLDSLGQGAGASVRVGSRRIRTARCLPTRTA